MSAAVIREDRSSDLTSLQDRIDHKSKSPYSHLAQNGIIDYNGVIFLCDDKNKALCLGDITSNPKNVLTIPLSKGGVIKVNRDNLGDLAKAISMFSPEEDKNSIGDGASEETTKTYT